MSTLHTISKSPKSQLLSECLPLVNKGDGILFIEDGVYYCANSKVSDDFESDVTWIFTLSSATSLKEFMTELIFPEL